MSDIDPTVACLVDIASKAEVLTAALWGGFVEVYDAACGVLVDAIATETRLEANEETK